LHIERLRDPAAVTLEEVRDLLFSAFGDRFSDDDWLHCLGGDHFIGTEGHRIVTHAALVPRLLVAGLQPVHAGYLEGVATAPAQQDKGFGSALMQRVTAVVDNEWELGVLSTSRHSFYERSGWQRWLGPTFVIDGQTRTRTADEDDGIMVRVPPGEHRDLAESLMCEARAGDDW
jgi:aminoglycoside 2'-N-acetyltransferase I